jgi:hypothetical protein
MRVINHSRRETQTSVADFHSLVHLCKFKVTTHMCHGARRRPQHAALLIVLMCMCAIDFDPASFDYRLTTAVHANAMNSYTGFAKLCSNHGH